MVYNGIQFPVPTQKTGKWSSSYSSRGSREETCRGACRGKCSCFLCSPCPFLDAEKPNSGPSHIRVILSLWPTHPVRLFLKVVAENQPQLERSSTPWGPQAFIFTALEMIRHHFQCIRSDLSPDAISHKAPTGCSSYVPLLSLVFLSVGHKNGSKCLFMSQMWGTSLTITRETTAAPSNVWANTQMYICIQTHICMNIYPFPLTLYPQGIEEAS